MNEANQNDCLVTGQRVHWTEMTARRGNSMKFSRREGKVASYNPGDPLVMVGAEYVEVVCLVLPTGENLWFEAEKGQDYMRQVIDKWKVDHPEFADTPCNMGAVHITMPREKYNAIGANFGPGCFVWP